MDLKSLSWDEELIRSVCGKSDCWDGSTEENIPLSSLPEIRASSGVFGSLHGIPCRGDKLALKGIPVGSILGDQQAALFGQTCYSAGEAKCTYGTGLFLLMVPGGSPVASTHGLLTTVAYQLDDG